LRGRKAVGSAGREGGRGGGLLCPPPPPPMLLGGEGALLVGPRHPAPAGPYDSDVMTGGGRRDVFFIRSVGVSVCRCVCVSKRRGRMWPWVS